MNFKNVVISILFNRTTTTSTATAGVEAAGPSGSMPVCIPTYHAR